MHCINETQLSFSGGMKTLPKSKSFRRTCCCCLLLSISRESSPEPRHNPMLVGMDLLDSKMQATRSSPLFVSLQLIA